MGQTCSGGMTSFPPPVPPVVNTLYTGDGTLAGPRLVTTDGHNILFHDTGTTHKTQIGGSFPHDERLAVVGTTETSSSFSTYRYSDFATGPNVSAAHARGSEAAPGALTSGTQMGKFEFVGHDGVGFIGSAEMRGLTTELWAPGSHGCELRWFTTANGTLSAQQRMLLGEDGRLLVDRTVLEGGATFAATTTTAVLGFVSTYACTNTAAPRTLTIMSADIAKGSVQNPWEFEVKDESLAAGTNAITIDTEGAELIDGNPTIVINQNGGSVRLYSNGSNLFTIIDLVGPPSALDGEIATYSGTDGRTVKAGGMRIINGAICKSLIATAIIAVGDICAVDTVNAQSCVLTSGTAEDRWCGVAVTAAGVGSVVWLAILGEATMNCAAPAVAIGDFMDPSMVVGQAHPHPVPTSSMIGIALTSKGVGAGPVQVMLLGKESF